jgi:phage repressor protein C with HTH and peptisase S24 domain
MEPAIQSGSSVLVSSIPYLFNSPKIDDIVAVKFDGKVLIKRVRDIEKNKYFITGDNPNDSFDSRKFGMIVRKDILGKVVSL